MGEAHSHQAAAGEEQQHEVEEAHTQHKLHTASAPDAVPFAAIEQPRPSSHVW